MVDRRHDSAAPGAQHFEPISVRMARTPSPARECVERHQPAATGEQRGRGRWRDRLHTVAAPARDSAAGDTEPARRRAPTRAVLVDASPFFPPTPDNRAGVAARAAEAQVSIRPTPRGEVTGERLLPTP